MTLHICCIRGKKRAYYDKSWEDGLWVESPKTRYHIGLISYDSTPHHRTSSRTTPSLVRPIPYLRLQVAMHLGSPSNPPSRCQILLYDRERVLIQPSDPS